MKKLIVLPAIALAFGCAMGGQETKKSEAMSAQDQAHQQLQQAADAQKRAADEQAQAEKDQQDVVQAQKALADAQARLRGQRMKARQAQEEARRLSQQATQEASQEQQQALQLQESQSQRNSQLNQSRSQEWTSQKDVQGRVLSASGDELQIRSSDQQLMKLGVTGSTAINGDGRSGTAAQIQPGSDVRASYQMIDGKAKALTIDVTSAGQSSQPSEQNVPAPPADQNAQTPPADQTPPK